MRVWVQREMFIKIYNIRWSRHFAIGFVEAQMGGDEHEPEVTVGYYAVRAVVDRRRKKIVTFQVKRLSRK